MSANRPLQISQGLLAALGTVFRYYEDRIPQSGPVVVSNHRSLWIPILMATMKRPIRFVPSHGAVPVMREIVTGQFGCFPEAQNTGSKAFQQAIRLMQTSQVVGVFPEGTKPMVQFT